MFSDVVRGYEGRGRGKRRGKGKGKQHFIQLGTLLTRMCSNPNALVKRSMGMFFRMLRSTIEWVGKGKAHVRGSVYGLMNFNLNSLRQQKQDSCFNARRRRNRDLIQLI